MNTAVDPSIVLSHTPTDAANPGKGIDADTYVVLAHTKLVWLREIAKDRLDPGERVLALISAPDGTRDWDTVWFDRSLALWVLCESGGNVDGEVLGFARVEVPA